jgi:hypothetical protein
MALPVARAHHDPKAILRVVPRPVVPAYTRALLRFALELGVRDAVRSQVTSVTRASWQPWQRRTRW